jgi:P4 family phage/plasmid primase-like protien
MLNDLLVYLSNYVANGKPSTHTGMFFPVIGAWSVPSGPETERMWELYNGLYHYCDGKRMGLGLTEVQQELSPILIDIDFKYSSTKGKNRRYTTHDLVSLMQMYATAIERYIQNPVLTGYIFEKERPRLIGRDQMKDGFHAMFDQVVTTKAVRKRIHNDVRQMLAERDDVFVRLYTDGVIDECAVTNNWIMYGGSKKDEQYAYQLTAVFNGQTIDRNVPKVTDTSLFRVRDRTETPLRSDITDQDLVLRPIVPPSRVLDEDIPAPVAPNMRQRVHGLLALLDPSRADSEPSWIRVGWCLHNISTENLDLWIEWSRQSDKFKEGECEKHWRRFRNDGYKFPSLCNWARHDNPEEYATFVKENAKAFLEYSVNCGAHYDIASIMYNKYSDMFRSVCPKKSDEWYHFENHRWKEMPGGYILMNKLSLELSNEFHEMREYHRRCMINADPQVVKVHKDKMDKCARLEYHVKDNGFKSGVLKECARMFYDGEFKDNLDTNCNLVCFENGIYDIANDEFRDGQPDDNVSKCTGINYDEDYSLSHPIIRDIFAFLRKVQPDPEMLDYVLTVLATYLGGSTEEQTFQIWTGSGSNGKSTIIELFEKTFGDDYCGKFPVTLLTRDRASSNACTPELQDVMRKRFGSMQEPNDNDVIYTGAMKEYTGGDKIYSRGLFSTPTPFKPQFKLVLLCNKMPQIKGWDYGTWRRIRVVNFTSSFVDEPNPENEHEFKKDKTLSARFDGWREGFMWLLVHYLRRYKAKGMIDPEGVRMASMDYKKKSDMYMQFMEDNFVQTNDDNDRLSIQEMYDAFKMWWRNMNTSAVPTKADFMEYLNANTKLRRAGKNHIAGIKYTRVEEI